MSKILITGATGHLGSGVVDKLLEKIPANQITVLVRNENKAQDFKTKGVGIKVGDYHNTASLSQAMEGIEQVLLVSSSDFNDRLGQHKNLVDAAKKAGVQHILYTGVRMKNIDDSPLKPLLADHYQTEDYIKASGMAYTFLQNSLYFEVIPMFLGEKVVETGVFFPAGKGKVSFVSRKDLAAVIANILTTEGHKNKTYGLSSIQAYSFAEIAAELSALSGKTVTYIDPSEGDFEATLKQIGLPAEIILMSVLFAAAIKNDDFNITDDTTERLLGHKQTDLKTYLKETFHL